MSLTIISVNDNSILSDGFTNTTDKHLRSRVSQYQRWLDTTGQHWASANLADYAEYLQSRHVKYIDANGNEITLSKLSPASTKAHLSTIRARYEAVLRSDVARDTLLGIVAAGLPDGSYADTFALVNEKIKRIENALHASNTPVKVIKKQDIADSEHLRLTATQATELIALPDMNTLAGLRDAAILAVLLCTGLREQELCNLQITDLRQKLGGTLALLVREGKGAKQRLIPYGESVFCLTIVDRWLETAGITDGVVFRGIRKGDKLRPTPLDVRSIQRILQAYPIDIDGKLTHVQPHDCRRTYARLLYEAGVDVVAIQQNLGHADLKTTLGYIGTLDADKRKPPKMYNASKILAKLPKQKRLPLTL